MTEQEELIERNNRSSGDHVKASHNKQIINRKKALFFKANYLREVPPKPEAVRVPAEPLEDELRDGGERDRFLCRV